MAGRSELKGIGPITAGHMIIVGAAVNNIITRAAENMVVTAGAGDGVSTGITKDNRP